MTVLRTTATRGDKPDKKTTEQGEQFLALNDTLKDELPKLYAFGSRLSRFRMTRWGAL
jgi:hypothetical protein